MALPESYLDSGHGVCRPLHPQKQSTSRVRQICTKTVGAAAPVPTTVQTSGRASSPAKG